MPRVCFNILQLTRGQSLVSPVPGHETCIGPATGTGDITCGPETFAGIGKLPANVWDGEPDAVYFPTDALAFADLPPETRHDAAYIFRFNPPHGTGLQMRHRHDGQPGHADQIETIPGIKDMIAKFK